MSKSIFLLTILFVNVLSVVVVLEDLYEEELPDIVIPSLIGGNFTPSLRSGQSQSSSPDLKTSNEEGGSGAEINSMPIRFHINDNATHYFVNDPTNQTDGYYIPIGVEYSELNGSRGQTYQHFYNQSTGEYTFNSGLLVNKSGVIDGSDWVKFEEYPNQFIIRLTNGSIYTRETPNEMNSLITAIGDNSTIWAVGYESYTGVMAFYLNFADLDWGHAQYIYYPRKLNGQLVSFNQPLYAIYPHLYVNYTGTIYDKILNDRALYDTPDKNPRNTLQFFNTTDTFGLYFSTSNISILSSNWDFRHGLKFNFTDNLFHLINDFRCNDRNFTDVGFAYEITSSPQSDGTSYQPDRFLIVNGTDEIELTISQAWEAGAYLEDFFSSIEIISQNNESFPFIFSDMANAGFTQKYLNLHNQQFPDGSSRLVLRAGMYGYGEYLNGTWINIDPSTGVKYATDNYDTTVESTTWRTGYTYGRFGGTGGSTYDWYTYWAFDTGVEVAIDSFSVNALDIYVTANDLDDSGEYPRLYVYNIVGSGNGADSNTGKEDSQSYSLGTNTYQDSVWDYNTATGGLRTGDTTKVDTLLEYWADYRGSGENYISFRAYCIGNDNPSESDYFQWVDSQGGTNQPRISFTYTELTNSVPTVSIQNDGDNIFAGIEETTMIIRYTDADGYNDIDDVWIDLSNDDFATYDIRLSWNVDTNVLTNPTGSTLLIGTQNDPTESTGGSATGASGYFDITWKFTIDWDTDWNDDDIDLRGDCDDESGAGATAVSDTDTGETFDDELIFKTSSWTLSDSAYSEDGNTNLATSEPEWFRGGVGVVASGVVSYELSTTTYPPTTQVDVELWVNGVDEGATHTDTTLGSSGEYSITSFTTVSTSGLDADYDFEVKFIGWAGDSDSGNTGTHTGNYLCDSKRDNEDPTYTSFTHADSNSGSGYDPQNGYDDDLTADYTLSGASDGSGSGLHSTPYRYEWNDGGYGSWTTSNTYAATVADGDSADADAELKDKVGNTITIDGEDIVIDDDDPIGYTASSTKLSGYSSGFYAYYTGGTLYFNSGQNDDFTLRVNDVGTIQNSGLWKIEWDLNSVFETTYDNTQLDTYQTFNYFSDTDGSFIIRIVNNAGNYQTILTYTATDDTTDPSISVDTETETVDTLYAGWGTISQGVYGSQMGTTPASFLVGGVASDAGSGLVAGVLSDNEDVWGGNPSMGGTIADWDFDYQIDESDNGDELITFTVYDSVGNSNTASYQFYEDNENPTASTGSNPDTNTGQGYDPLTNYYDDDSVIQGRSYGDNYGVNGGRYKIDSNDWATGWISTAFYEHLSVSNGNHTLTYIARDDVNNTLTVYGWVIVDTTDPTGFTFTWSRVSGYIDGYHAYWTGSILYHNNGDDYFTIDIANDGSMGESGFYRVAWDTVGIAWQSLWDFSGLPDSKNFNYNGAGGSGFWLTTRIVNKAGNYQEEARQLGVDSTNPSAADITGEDESSDYLYHEYGTTYEGVYGSQMSVAQSYIVSGTATDAASGIQFIDADIPFADDPSSSGTTAWSFTYEITAAVNGDESITYTAYDACGNSLVITQTYDFYEDNTAPTGITGWIHSDSGSGSYDPNNGYEDDLLARYTWTGSLSDNYGTPTDFFQYNWLGGGYSSWAANGVGYYDVVVVDDDVGDSDARFRDAVFNILTIDGEDITVDTDSPSGFSLTWLYHTGFDSGYYVYLTGTDLYFNPSETDIFRITVNNDGTIQNSGFWKVEWDKNSVFITGNNDSSGLPDTQDFAYNGDTDGSFVIRVINNAGNYQTFTYSAIEDSTDPTFSSFDLDVDSFANDPNYYHTLFPNTTLVNPADSGAGLATDYLEYSVNGSWGAIDFNNDLTFEWNISHGIADQSNHTLDVRIYDMVGNYLENPSDWVVCDTIPPEALILSMDEMYSPNFYDQSIAHTANITVTWNEAFPYYVDYSGVLSGSDDTDPSGGSSTFALSISGESNGWYQVNINVLDKAGWNDSVLVIPTYGYGIVQLDSSLGSDEVDVWFYFYFFKSNGLGLDWKDYNVSYAVDEAWYPNVNLTRIRGGLFAQKFLNFTSTIRFEVRDFFGNLIHNQTYPLPTSRDIYIELAVNTFKTVNLYSDIVNMSLVRGSVTYSEQLMPNEIFAWNLYAAEYNLTVYLHKYGSAAYDDEGNQLVNHSIDLSSYDVAIFIRDIYEGLCSVLLTDQSNNFLDPRGFKIFIEDVRIYGDTFLWNDTLATKNITITDLFGNLLDQDLTTAYSRFIEIALSIWNVKVFNLDSDPIHLHITQNNLNVSEWILQYTVEEFYLKNGTYTMHFYYTDLDDGYVVENGTFVTKVAQVFSDLIIFVESDDIIAVAVSVDVPQPADPNIEVTVAQNNTEVIYLVEDIQGEVGNIRGEISFIGSFLALAMLAVLVIILLALFLPQRYDQIREKVRDGRIKIYEKGENVKDEYFPEVDF